VNRSRQDLLPIGNFARATRLSQKALRLYDQLGVLRPIYVEPESGYRYYHADQLREARLIRMMRQMGMPLATIRQVLAAAPAEAELLVQGHVRAMEAQVAQARRIVHDVMSAFRKEERSMSLEVSVHAVASQPVVSTTGRVRVNQLERHIGDSLDTLYGFIRERGAVPAGPAFGLYHGTINEEDDGPIEVCVPVQEELTGKGDVTSRTMPGGQMASVTLQGAECEFPEILKGYDAVYDWIRQNGYEPENSPRETWHSIPGEQPARMEVAWLLRESTGA
jgi:DNA-binding transcriptional MerR regulator